jgi:TolB-like protein
MKDGYNEKSKRKPRTASEWFVYLDGDASDPPTDEEFESWLAQSSAHEEALARCDAAMFLSKALEEDPELGWAYDEAARLAAGPPPTRAHVPARDRARALRSPALAWSVAGLSTIVTLVALLNQEPERAVENVADTIADTGAGEIFVSARPEVPFDMAAELTTWSPAVVLPGQVIVDARSLAVMPFDVVAAAGKVARAADQGRARTFAAELHGAVVRQLAAIPGIYVAEPESVIPYADTDLRPVQVAAQLGVRGIVEGRVAFDDGRIRVVLRLTDAASNEVMWQSAFDGRTGALSGIDADLATDLAFALAHARDSNGRMANN